MKPYAVTENEDYKIYKNHENVYSIIPIFKKKLYSKLKVHIYVHCVCVCIYTFDCSLENILKNIQGEKTNQNVHSGYVNVEDYILLFLFFPEVLIIHFFNLFEKKDCGNHCEKLLKLFFNKSNMAHTIGFITLVDISRIYPP